MLVSFHLQAFQQFYLVLLTLHGILEFFMRKKKKRTKTVGLKFILEPHIKKTSIKALPFYIKTSAAVVKPPTLTSRQHVFFLKRGLKDVQHAVLGSDLARFIQQGYLSSPSVLSLPLDSGHVPRYRFGCEDLAERLLP